MQKMTVQFLQWSWSVLKKKVDMEGLQFAQQQFYKVHFLLASKISLFISEGKNPPKSGTLGQTQKNESNSKDSSFQTSDLYNIVLIVDTLDN